MNTKTKKSALTIIRLARDAERDQAVLHRCGRTQVELDDDFNVAMADLVSAIAAFRRAEETIAATLKDRGYEPGSSVDAWAPIVAKEVRSLAEIRVVLSCVNGEK